MQIQDKLMDFIRMADRSGAGKLLDEWALENGYDHLIEEVIEPVLVKIGEMYAKNDDLVLAQGYVAAKITQDALEKVASTIQRSDDLVQKGPVVIGNIEDDYHSLGRQILVTYLRARNWVVIDLGNDVPAEQFVDTAVEAGAKVIGASAMMYTTAKNIINLRAEIDNRNLKGKIQLAVGGAIFVLRPELVEEFGGDGTARHAIGASDLFDELWSKAIKFDDVVNK